jgi:hypothetical protein
MKVLFSNNYIEVILIKGIVFGFAKADDDYALLFGCIIIEFKPHNMFRKTKNTPNTF